MSFFVFPSQSRPQFIFSNRKEVVIFFMNNFLYTRRKYLQLLVNILRLTVPETLLYLFLIIAMRKIKLPNQLSEAIEKINKFIHGNRALFFLNSGNHENISFIIRHTSWQRNNDKFTVILFRDFDKRPFAIAKVGSSKYKDSTESEFRSTQTVYSKFKDNKSFLIPEPIAFYASDKKTLHFEKAIEGVPFNDYLKIALRESTKKDLYIDVLEKCKNLSVNLHCEDQLLATQDFYRYFISPLEELSNTALGDKYPSKFNKLKEQTEKLQINNLNSVWMHGDLWGGSILYSKGEIGIIDWEFFTKNGVPLWDFFSFAFHTGADISNKPSMSSDFMNYFTNQDISAKVDSSILYLAKHFHINEKSIPFLFQSYLLFNMQHRDTDSEKYWQSCLEDYWDIADNKVDLASKLL